MAGYQGPKQKECRSPKVFKLLDGTKSIFLLVRPVLKAYDPYIIFWRRVLGSQLRLEEVRIRTLFTSSDMPSCRTKNFVWPSPHSMRCHNYLFSITYDLHSVLKFTYAASFVVSIKRIECFERKKESMIQPSPIVTITRKKVKKKNNYPLQGAQSLLRPRLGRSLLPAPLKNS